MIATLDGGTYEVKIDSEAPGLREIRCKLSDAPELRSITSGYSAHSCRFRVPRSYSRTAALLTENHHFTVHHLSVEVMTELPFGV